jgi:hypothetical protein
MSTSWWCDLLGEAAGMFSGPQTDRSASISAFSECCAEKMMQQTMRLIRFWEAMVKVLSPSRRFLVTDWGIASCAIEITKVLLYCAASLPEHNNHDLVKSAFVFVLKFLDPLAEISAYVGSCVSSLF